uniref:Zinc finger, CCHC-type n=1 Tax=Tanacetum cinerariifolium TaxID=118510 RepID=A0A6L2J3I3_TANCI|nr:zinc finger, CCHC-type [Tanacetum cinerariifolium]
MDKVSTQDSERNDEDSAPSPMQNNTHGDISDDDEIEQPIDNPSTPLPYTYKPNSEDSTGYTSPIASSSRPFDHTPVQGYRNLSEIYDRAPEVQSDELLLLEEEPRNYKEATQDKNKEDLQKFKSQMEERFKMSDLGLLAYCLGIEVTQTEGGISIKQTGYANKILKEARMLWYQHRRRQRNNRDHVLLWELTSSQKQPIVALSSCESEFMAATAAACQALWLQRPLNALTSSKEEKVTIRVDNKSAIALMMNPLFHERSKHIDIRYHFIRECVEKNQIEVEHISGDLQKADILTKALARIKFAEMRELLGVKELKE